MALINCYNCGKPVSDKAVKCPHCGEFVHSENLSVKPFGFHAAWIVGLIGVAALWGLYCLDVLNLHILNDDRATYYNSGTFYTYTMTAFLIAIVIAALLVTINLWRKSLKVCLCLTLVGIVALIAAGAYDRFNPSDSNGYGQEKLASYYMDKGDFQNAFKWYEKAAICCNVDACNSLGEMYAKGKGVEKSNEKAISWFQQTLSFAERDDLTYYKIIAHKNLGHVYWEQKNAIEAVIQFDTALQLAESDKHYSSEAEELREIMQKCKIELKSILTEMQSKDEASINTQTLDMSAFMLHGKVKSFAESFGGQAGCTYYFSEQGKITKAVMSEGNYRCKISRQANKLILSFENPDDEFGGWAYVYTVDNSGRLTSSKYGSEDFGDETTYSNFDSNGWPTRSKTIAELGGAVTISSISYPKIDEHGNWTQQSLKDDGGNVVTVYRTIKYYE